jgi:hypothetical protein
MPIETPVITVAPTDTGYELQATSYGRTSPAGQRLFRGRPWPVVSFSHTTKAAAEKDAATLTDYLRNPPKKGGHSEEAEVKTKAAKRGWWQD